MTAIRVATWNLWWRFGDRGTGPPGARQPGRRRAWRAALRVDHVLLGLGRGRVPVGVEGVGLFGTAPWGGVWPSDHAGWSSIWDRVEPAA